MAVIDSSGFAGLILGPHAFEDIFLNGCIEIRTGLQPANADAAATGTLVARITRDGGAWTAGSPANGLQFQRAGRYVIKHPLHIWRLVGIATGVAGWFRLRTNAADAGGVSLDAPRIDGLIAPLPEEGTPPSPAQMFLPSLAITPSTDVEIAQWYYAKPPL